MDVVREIDFILDELVPISEYFLIGLSMGSIVSQCYIAVHPSKVVGYLNMFSLQIPQDVYGFQHDLLFYQILSLSISELGGYFCE